MSIGFCYLKFIVLGLLFSILPMLGISQLLSTPAHGQEVEVKSYLEGVFENANSWRQFDCLIEIEFVSSDPAGPQYLATGRHRIIMDKDADRLLVVKFQEYENAESPGEDLKKTATFHALTTADGLLWYATDQSGPRKLNLKRLPKILSTIEIVDPRKIGCVHEKVHVFGTPDKDWSFEKCFEGMKSGRLIGKALNGKDDVLLTFKNAYQDSNEPVSMYSYVFSKETMLPVSSKTSHSISRGPTFGSDEKIRWTRVDQAWVPTLYSGVHQNKSAAPADDVFFNESYTYKIHWFSVNQAIDEKAFDPSVCENRSYALSLIDPIKLNATSILEEEQRAK